VKFLNFEELKSWF